jgi:hypothetical protein
VATATDTRASRHHADPAADACALDVTPAEEAQLRAILYGGVVCEQLAADESGCSKALAEKINQRRRVHEQREELRKERRPRACPLSAATTEMGRLDRLFWLETAGWFGGRNYAETLMLEKGGGDAR